MKTRCKFQISQKVIFFAGVQVREGTFTEDKKHMFQDSFKWGAPPSVFKMRFTQVCLQGTFEECICWVYQGMF